MKYSTTAEFQIFWNNERPFFKDRRVRQAFFFSSRRRHTSSLRDWSSDVCSSDLASYLNEIPSRTRYSATLPSWIVTSKRVASATRRSRIDCAAVCTAFLAAASHDSVLVPITSVTRYTLSVIFAPLDRGGNMP